MAANDNITITVVNFRGTPRQFTISRNITIMALQQILIDEKDFLIFDEEDSPYTKPTILNIRLCIISNDHLPVIFNNLDRTLAQYNIDRDAVINALFDPIEIYYNTNVPPSATTLADLESMRTCQRLMDSLNDRRRGGKRSRRKSRNRKTRRSRKHMLTHVDLLEKI